MLAIVFVHPCRSFINQCDEKEPEECYEAKVNEVSANAISLDSLFAADSKTMNKAKRSRVMVFMRAANLADKAVTEGRDFKPTVRIVMSLGIHSFRSGE